MWLHSSLMRAWCEVRNFACRKFRLTPDCTTLQNLGTGADLNLVNSLVSGCFRGFSEKKRLNARGLAREFLWSGKLYKPGKSLKRHGKASSLHSKKIFCLGGVFFCEWRHKRRIFRPPWPTLPGPGRQPLGGSISLKFLLETRLQSESFDTLDDLLRFRVQTLWCKLVKIFE